jgi:hypothetical protein
MSNNKSFFSTLNRETTIMKRLITFILAAGLSFSAFAQGTQPASTASIEKLLEVTETRQMYDASMKEMSKMIEKAMAGTLKRLPPEKQTQLKQVISDIDKLMQKEANWGKMKPLYMQIYKETFTQQEVDDLMAFYQTPSGKSFVRKQPVVLQKMTALTQEKMSMMMERLPGMVQKAMEKGN